jgi:hypothetical protein
VVDLALQPRRGCSGSTPGAPGWKTPSAIDIATAHPMAEDADTFVATAPIMLVVQSATEGKVLPTVDSTTTHPLHGGHIDAHRKMDDQSQGTGDHLLGEQDQSPSTLSTASPSFGDGVVINASSRPAMDSAAAPTAICIPPIPLSRVPIASPICEISEADMVNATTSLETYIWPSASPSTSFQSEPQAPSPPHSPPASPALVVQPLLLKLFGAAASAERVPKGTGVVAKASMIYWQAAWWEAPPSAAIYGILPLCLVLAAVIIGADSGLARSGGRIADFHTEGLRSKWYCPPGWLPIETRSADARCFQVSQQFATHPQCNEFCVAAGEAAGGKAALACIDSMEQNELLLNTVNLGDLHILSRHPYPPPIPMVPHSAHKLPRHYHTSPHPTFPAWCPHRQGILDRTLPASARLELGQQPLLQRFHRIHQLGRWQARYLVKP